VHELDDSSYVLIANDARVYYLDHVGAIKLVSEEYEHLKIPWTSFTSFPNDPDQLIYVVTLEDGCDFVYDYKVHTFNLNGERIATENFDDEPFLPSDRFVFPQLPGLPKYLLEGRLYYRPDSIVAIPGHEFSSEFGIADDGDIYFLKMDSIFKYEFNHDSLFLTARVPHNLSNAFDLFVNSDSSIIAGSEKKIVFFNQDLVFLNEFYAPANEKINTFYWHDPFLIARVDINSSVNKYYIFDSKLNLEFTTTLALKDIHISDMFWKPDSTLTITGYEFYRDDKIFAFLKTFSYSVVTRSHDQNIALSGLRFENVIVGDVGECYYSDTTRWFLIKNASIQITNHGDNSINNVTITPLKTYCSWWCDSQEQFFHTLTEMDLQPGQTKDFFIGDIPVEREDRNPSNHQLCLTAILPGGHIDIDHSDNMYCFDLTTSIDHSEKGNPAMLYPNPVEDILHIYSSDRIKSITINNIQGNTLLRLDEIEKDQLNVSQLIPGLYFIRFEYDNGYISSDRFLKL